MGVNVRHPTFLRLRCLAHFITSRAFLGNVSGAAKKIGEGRMVCRRACWLRVAVGGKVLNSWFKDDFH
ncbi:hypothetical protein [Pectobacterium cacticida]|uniref:hypothetical protein n=1 Tax=Pectobacterium cacticida TaxID=69221 RepID=UPI002FF0DB83